MPDIAVPGVNFWPETPFTKQSNLRLFYRFSDQYVVFANLDASSRKAIVSKSVDGGATWNLVGGPGPALYHKLNGVGIDLMRETLSAVQSGDLLYVFHSEATNGFIAVTIFDMSTDTWGATFTSAFWYFTWYLDPFTTAWTDQGSFYQSLTAIQRDTGNFIVFYYGQAHTVAGVGSIGSDLHYVEFDDGSKTFGPEVQVTVDAVAPGNELVYTNPQLVLSGNRIHFFYQEIDATQSLTQRSLNVANVLGTQQSVGPQPNTGLAEMVVGQPITFTYAAVDYIACPLNAKSGGPNLIWVVWGPSADDPVLAPEQAQSGGPTPNQLNDAWPASMLFDGACLYCLWATEAKAGAASGRIDFYASAKRMCDLAVPWQDQTLIFQDNTANRIAFASSANLRNGKADWVYSGDVALPGTPPLLMENTGFVAIQEELNLPACPCGAPRNLYVTVKQMCDLSIPWRDETLLASDVMLDRRTFESRVRFRPNQDTVDYIYSGDTSADATGYLSIQLNLPVPACPCAPPPPPPVKRIIRKIGNRRMVVLVPNRYDVCLRGAIPDWQRVGYSWTIPQIVSVYPSGTPSSGVGALPARSSAYDPEYYVKSDDEVENNPSKLANKYFDMVRFPRGAIQFHRMGSVPTPAPADGDIVVLQFRVPLGYDAVIRGIVHKYTGPGFREGGGDIIWRVHTNNRYAKQMGQILVTLGSLSNMYSIRDGIFVPSGKQIQYIVNVPDLSGGILIGGSNILAGVEGWMIPRT